eukprot:TRINITY_DN13382_c0_g1_i1.p1 TRINITY_DN13382_c0_g1~~TRINITY_DN13382_c0_g1_i1.p1  ORF type:complete len:893 (+),score=252.37 TRINITY_DN13382_c0_g1_i1:156-2834(+)
MVRYGGEVKHWFEPRGLGTVKCDPVAKKYGAEPLLQLKEVLASGLAKEDLKVGMKISFEVAEGNGGRPVATALKILSAGLGAPKAGLGAPKAAAAAGPKGPQLGATSGYVPPVPKALAAAAKAQAAPSPAAKATIFAKAAAGLAGKGKAGGSVMNDRPVFNSSVARAAAAAAAFSEEAEEDAEADESEVPASGKGASGKAAAGKTGKTSAATIAPSSTGKAAGKAAVGKAGTGKAGAVAAATAGGAPRQVASSVSSILKPAKPAAAPGPAGKGSVASIAAAKAPGAAPNGSAGKAGIRQPVAAGKGTATPSKGAATASATAGKGATAATLAGKSASGPSTAAVKASSSAFAGKASATQSTAGAGAAAGKGSSPTAAAAAGKGSSASSTSLGLAGKGKATAGKGVTATPAASSTSKGLGVKELSGAVAEALDSAIGELSAAPIVLHAFAEDGAPKVILSMAVLNSLLEALNMPTVDYTGFGGESAGAAAKTTPAASTAAKTTPAASPSGKTSGKATGPAAKAPGGKAAAQPATPPPSSALANKGVGKGAGKSSTSQPSVQNVENEPLRGFDGTKVPDGSKWYWGTIVNFSAAEAYGTVDSSAFKAAFSDRPLYIHADHIDPEGNGDLVAQIGDEIIFHIVEDQEGELWAWPPIIPKARDFNGTIKTWTGQKGWLKCDVLQPIFENDVFIHSAAAEYGGVDAKPGAAVTFNLHVSEQGQAQASSPRPLGMPVPTKSAQKRGYSQPDSGAAGEESGDWSEWGQEQDASPAQQMAKRLRGPPQADMQARGSAGKGGAYGGKGRGAPVEEPVEEPQDEWSSSEQWYQGTVKSFDYHKGYGFVACQELHEQTGRDTYLSHAALGYMEEVPIGASVWFQIMLTPQGFPQVAAMEFEDLA